MLVHWGLAFVLLTALVLIEGLKDRSLPRIYPITLAYILLTSNLVICFRQLSATLLNEYQMSFILSTTCFSVFTILIFSMGAYYARGFDCLKIMRITVVITSILGTFLFLIPLPFGFEPIKLIPHASSNATMIVLGIPYLLPENKKQWPRLLLIALIITATVLTNASSPLGVACVITASYFLLKKVNPKLLLLTLLPLVAGGAYWGWGKVFDDTLRFKAYEIFMGEWVNGSFWTVMLGYGSGSFEILGQVIQLKHMFGLWVKPNGVLAGELWMHLHSDILQIFFEYGLIGATLVFASAWCTFERLGGLNKEKAVLLACMASMVFDFPLRYPVIPLVFVFLFAIATTNRDAVEA